MLSKFNEEITEINSYFSSLVFHTILEKVMYKKHLREQNGI